ncbi:acetyl-CoA C-acyltransferase [Flavobacteriaceae bacterium]|nr:acetyl-CoA C-acyltransferase [Flavobacteriaceae bacterium]MDB4067178.1 acetyl-CoA C-acyltransferase [Flavobacteriaceae bacterium]MDB4151964.1 acetyl-CoA C-acyltransferase [Flavobacteriaceae bacterium]MDB9988001.1 acetyl-CoA C-acyltransferase [Flavobacteriaceae bacterium]|tara:strand:+ start:1839 stop:3017 length:1179 start_codon:yes stop_codon:yes gene_type:complete
MKRHKAVIVSAKRTPIGKFMGGLSTVPAPKLGAIAIQGALAAVGLDAAEVDEVYMGNVLQAGLGQAPARQAAIFAGIPDSVPCTTVNKVCSSGMKTIMMAAQAIALGDAEVVVAGGMENMSLAPHIVPLRTGVKFGATQLEDVMQKDGLVDAFDQVAMGTYADATATKHQISRADQDAFAIESYRRSAAAWESGVMQNEVVSVSVPQRRGEDIQITEDEEFTNVLLDKIPKLRPAFTKDGTVTAANASTINDGAAAVIVMSEEKAKVLGLTPLATIEGYADAAQEPQWFTTAPAKALPKALAKAAVSLDEVALFEFNEAFSVVGLANMQLLELDSARVNIHGGAVSLGHPLGCSGARIVVTLLHAMKHKKLSLGAAAICNGGGGGSAIVLRR